MAKKGMIHIDSLAFGGNGVGRIDGKVCFVPYSCPGDDLRVMIDAEKRSFMTASIAETVSPSPDRVAPRCPLFGVCGGCSWQHVSYASQKDAKQAILAQALWRGAKIPADRIGAIVPAPEEYGYRSRVQFKVSVVESSIAIGFYRKNSHVVADAPDGCPIAMPAINQAMAAFRACLDSCPDVGGICGIHIETAENGVIALLDYAGTHGDELRAFFTERQHQLEPLAGLYMLQRSRVLSPLHLFGEQSLLYTLSIGGHQENDRLLSYLPGSFSQVNRQQNQNLLLLLARMIAPVPGMKLLDLYCGNGNFSLPLTAAGACVTGVEVSAASIASARHNCQLNGITNATYLCADVQEYVRKAVEAGERFDCVLLDPPRSGAAEIVAVLPRLRPKKIAYVSCDPSTLARDCSVLTAAGYQVCESVPVDMFPQTWHLESVTLFEKNDKETN
jgi:23S rRNA (uracil1939-C5)-methyltransferase